MKNIWYYGYTKEQYESCKIYRDTSNDRNVKNIATVAGTLEFMFGLVSMFISVVNKYNYCYLLFGMITLAIAVSVRIKGDQIPSVLKVYVLMTVAFLFGIIISIPSATEKSLIFPIALVLLPILFIDIVWRMSLFLVFVTCIFSIFVVMVKVPQVAQMDIFNACGMMLVSIFLQYFVNKNVVAGFISQAQNDKLIGAYQKIQEELSQKARTDLMTGLYNRTYFTNEAIHFFEDCDEERDTGYLVMMDLDRFKHINDTLGHQAGDRVIIGVADIIRKHLKGTEYAARLGGDEYIFVLAERFHNVEIKEVIAAILQEVQKIHPKEGEILTSSLGITKISAIDAAFEEMYRATDQALYRAKKRCGNQFEFGNLMQE